MVMILYTWCPLYASRSTIIISSQTDYDKLQRSFNKIVKTGKDSIFIYFKPGHYITKEHHFELKGIDNPDMKIAIIGNGATLIPKGKTYKDGDSYEGGFAIENSWMTGEKDVSIWSSMKIADGQVEVVDQVSKLCRIKSAECLPTMFNCDKSFILIPQTYLSQVYKITKISNQWIYFIAHDLRRVKAFDAWSVNSDYYFGRAHIRYKLCNVDNNEDCVKIINGIVKLPRSVPVVREGSTHRFFSIEDCVIKELSIGGFKVLGNRNGDGGAAIYLYRLKADKCRIYEIDFYGIHSDVIKVIATNNTVIEGNRFQDCYLHGIFSAHSSKKTTIIGNTFDSMGKAMSNTLCIACKGADFVIRDNILKNFGNGGIGVGLWYLEEKKRDCSGEITNNELFYTDSYIADKIQYCLMDGGAIYLWTKMDGVCIRHNYIHDIEGMFANRGIFCDDGAYNFDIIGNVIVRIGNSYCIESRRVKKVEEQSSPGSGISHSNVNIAIADNIVDGRIKFIGNESVSDNNCYMGSNFYLRYNNSNNLKNETRNTKVIGDGISIKQKGFYDGKIEIRRKDSQQLLKSKAWKHVRSHFNVLN